MDNADCGDLSDIVRCVTAAGAGPMTSSDIPELATDPAAPFNPLSTDDFVSGGDGFGIQDLLLHELTGSTFYSSVRSESNGGGGEGGGCDQLHTHEIEIKRSPNCVNLFSRVLQISPADHDKPSPLSSRAIKPLPMAAVDHAVQISSPRNTPGIKRRKSQAKKVVCIPAAAAASSRPSGEVVPSDLWAWRKYGQKPIKGSPYPRGYYRCSSSKGCSARKQVERSRTDPNMLVITYTSEHNHPWPTQRNALAGSTRSQPSKIGSSTWKHLKEEPKDTNNIANTAASTSSFPVVKEEEVVLGDHQILLDKVPMANDHSFDQVFYSEPITDDLFADLAELESDPMSLIFSSRSDEEEIKERNKGADSFINMFDWGDS